MKYAILKYTISLCIFIQATPLGAFISSDTIPPVFTTNPTDIGVSCDSDIITEFTDWFVASANAEADNGGASVNSLYVLAEALDSLDNALIECSGTGSLDIGFFAVDSCGNISLDTLFASFTVFDNIRPQITDPGRDISMLCDEFAQDSLDIWVQNASYAVASDNCDTMPQWVNYAWNDSNGASGFGSFGEEVDIPISRMSCMWSVELRFFIQDACGNINSHTSVFSIEGDNDLPEIISAPADTVILCHQAKDTIDPLIIDGCDGELDLVFIEIDDRSADTLSCAHYEYQITREWSAIDACGNAISYTQVIQVVDTLAPTLNFESIISKDCDDDLDLIEDFVEYSDNCSVRSIEYKDTLLVSQLCVSQYDREYTVVDQCDNQRIVQQRILVEDFTGPEFIVDPEDRLVYCGSGNINLNFQNWISNYANAQVEDNCNGYVQYVRNSPNLSDSLTIANAMEATLEAISCNTAALDDIIFSQDFYFYAIDDCGNITSNSASFNLIDTLPPVIPNCPNDLDVVLEDDECDNIVSINPPFVIDPCLSLDDTEWTIRIDDVFLYEETNESIDFNFDIGEHSVEYLISDCSGNTSECIQIINVIDSFPPVIECPDDIELFLPSDTCSVELTVPEIEAFSDNCFGIADFSATQPEAGGFIEFTRDPIDSSFSASSFIIEFEDIITDQRFFKPVITIEYALNIDIRSRLVLKSELSEELFIAEKAPCVRQKHKLVLSEAQFEIWSKDHDIKFNVSVEEQGGKGLLPCLPENLDGDADIDEFSFFTISLSFTEVDPDFTIMDEANSVLYTNEKTISLESGDYSLNYFAEDFAGNQSSCFSAINVRDTFPPSINCLDQEVVLTPDTEEFIDIDLDDLNILVDDNCEIADISYFPSDFSCQQINRTIPLVIQAWDVNDNFNFCTAQLSIRAARLEPQFVGGLCLADTLKLFANLDTAITGEFLWSGPNGFSSTDRDPVISNIDQSYSGVYQLSLLTNNACEFTGTVIVDIDKFISPEITSVSDIICDNESLILQSNDYSEEVMYYWYKDEGNDQQLLMVTDESFVELNPGIGQHSYFVQVEGEDCNSNESELITIEVLETPQATISESFVSVCEGDDILISSLDSIGIYDYLWEGPDGFISMDAFPAAITEASSDNEGLYSLRVSNQSCVSEPDMVQVIVLELPETPEIEHQDSYCEGEAAELTVSNHVSAGNTFRWYLNGVLYSTQSSNTFIIPNIDNDLNGKWTLIVDDGSCESEISEEIDLSLEAIPNIGASNNGPVCEGDSIRLTASFIPNATYEWSDPMGTRFFDREISPLAVPGIYTVTVTSSNGCQNSTSTLVEVGLRPQITALSNSATECMENNSSFVLNPTIFPPGNYQYKWTGPDNFSSDEKNPVISNIDQDNAGVYQLVVIEDECSSEIAETFVEYTIIPDAAVIMGDTAVCENACLMLEIIDPITDPNAEWIWQTPQGLIRTSEAMLKINSFNNTLQGNYSVYQELNDCRSKISNSINVISIDEIARPRINGSTTICEGEAIELIANSVSASLYYWILPSGDTIIQNSPILTINASSQTEEGSYTLFVSQGDCVSELSDEFDLNILELTSTPVFESSLISHCKSEDNALEICIDANNIDFNIIQISEQNSGDVLLNSDEECISIILDEYYDQDTIRLIARVNKNNCWSENSEELIIILEDIPSEYLELSDTQIILCEQYDLQLEPDLIPDDIEALWQSSDPEIIFINDDDILTSIINLDSGSNHIFLNSQNASCGIFASDTIEIIVLDELEANDDSFTFQYGDQITLDILDNDLLSSSVEIISTNTSVLGKYELENDLLIFNNDPIYGSITISYTICYEHCPSICSSARVDIRIEDENNCLVGNIITNNSDGINDLFVVTCLENNAFPDNVLVIFNRWGDEIFRAAPYLNDWDGSYRNEDLPSGTYYYFLDLGDGSEPLNGFIVVE